MEKELETLGLNEALKILEDVSKEEIVVRNGSTVYMNSNDNKGGAFTRLTTVGSYFKSLDAIKQVLLKSVKLEEENKKMKNVLLELAEVSPDNVDCIYQCKSITNTILEANISDDVNNKCKKNLEDLDFRDSR